MSRSSKREARRARHRRARQRSYLVWGGIAAVSLAIFAFLIWNTVKPAAGEEVPLMASRDHVPEGTDPGPHNTDPPTSGPHYASPARAGFYEQADMGQMGPFPEGHLIHSLEHGYVIFWYNCDNLTDGECDTLKSEIRQVMGEFDDFKVIGVPWDSIEEPVVMTSWGRVLRFDQFDLRQARTFIERNRGRAPEPTAP